MTCRQGTCTYAQGGSYEGDWREGRRSGWGCLRTPDGQSYEGEWEGDTMHGERHRPRGPTSTL